MWATAWRRGSIFKARQQANLSLATSSGASPGCGRTTVRSTPHWAAQWSRKATISGNLYPVSRETAVTGAPWPQAATVSAPQGQGHGGVLAPGPGHGHAVHAVALGQILEKNPASGKACLEGS